MNVNTQTHGGRWFAEVEYIGHVDSRELGKVQTAAIDAIRAERGDLDTFAVVLDRREERLSDGKRSEALYFHALRTAAEVSALVSSDEEEFMRTHVSRYVLPKKLDAAQTKGAANVSVPTADMTRLLARVGEHVAPVEPVTTAPAIPESVQSAATELVGMLDWDADGESIVTREQINALALQVARIAHAAPRATVRRKAAASVTETVAAAIAAGKRAVSVPVGDLARMLDAVQVSRTSKAQGVAA